MEDIKVVLEKEGYVIEKGVKNGKPHMTIRRLNESNN